MQNKYGQKPEKRYFPRWGVNHRLVFHKGLNSNSQEARTIDVSCTGIRFLTDEEVQLGERIKMDLYFAIDKHVELTGDVIWLNGGTQSKEVGVQFFNTEDEAQNIILEHAFEIKKEDLIDNWFKGWNK